MWRETIRPFKNLLWLQNMHSEIEDKSKKQSDCATLAEETNTVLHGLITSNTGKTKNVSLS